VPKRVTILFDEDLDKKIRQIQAKRIQNASGSVSFSEVINDLLKKSLK